MRVGAGARGTRGSRRSAATRSRRESPSAIPARRAEAHSPAQAPRCGERRSGRARHPSRVAARRSAAGTEAPRERSVFQPPCLGVHRLTQQAGEEQFRAYARRHPLAGRSIFPLLLGRQPRSMEDKFTILSRSVPILLVRPTLRVPFGCHAKTPGERVSATLGQRLGIGMLRAWAMPLYGLPSLVYLVAVLVGIRLRAFVLPLPPRPPADRACRDPSRAHWAC